MNELARMVLMWISGVAFGAMAGFFIRPWVDKKCEEYEE